MNELVIFHHLGLGDHFICHGIVRSYLSGYEKVWLFCKKQNVGSVSHMFWDEMISGHLSLIAVDDDTAAVSWIQQHPDKKYLIVGFNQLNNTEPFDQQFYKLSGVPFKVRWDAFYSPRFPNEEVALVEKLQPPEKFALIHEDPSRGYAIKSDLISLPIIRFDRNHHVTIPPYRLLAETASEIHVIDSSVMFFIDSLDDLPEIPLFAHRYSRVNPEWQLPTLKKNWILIK